MTISTRTPEGWPVKCPVCGHPVTVNPSQPLGDAICPRCGSLFWFAHNDRPVFTRFTWLSWTAATLVGISVLVVLAQKLSFATALTLSVVTILILGRRVGAVFRALGICLASWRR